MTPAVLEPKLIIQELWKKNIEWDEDVPDDLAQRWSKWQATLPNLSKTEIPRWYHTNFSAEESIELHGIADPSSVTYEAVSFLQIRTKDDIRCKFVSGKSRLCPIKEKFLTIPKLELQVAVIAARMKTKIVEEIELGINQVFMWSDSKTVINFMKNEHTRFNVYILHRTNEIRNLTKSAGWRHIPGKLNAADFATKYSEFSKLMSTCSWYNSPNFLYERYHLDLLDSKDHKETHEPKTKISSIEQKVEQPVITNNLPLIFNYSKYSSFQKLIRHVAG